MSPGVGIKLPASRRIILPLTALQTADHGFIYWASLSDIEHERSGVDMELVAAAEQAMAEKAKVRKAERIKKTPASPRPGSRNNKRPELSITAWFGPLRVIS